MESNTDIQQQYQRRFQALEKYRGRVWRILIDSFFQPVIGKAQSVLDLGAGYGEFIGQINAANRYAMDLNPDCCKFNSDGVQVLLQDCSAPWDIEPDSLDVVFTSNFLEHLPDKDAVRRTLLQAFRALRQGGKIICMGPNISILHGTYWDFWDHHVALSELALKEIVELCGFQVTRCERTFLPYSMSKGWQPPLFLLRIYLRFTFLWPYVGKQFLVIAEK